MAGKVGVSTEACMPSGQTKSARCCRAWKNAVWKIDIYVYVYIHINVCWWTVCRDQQKKEMAGLRVEADKVPGKCPALPV